MSLDFLREAFTKLNEEVFDTDSDSLDNLEAFMDNSDDTVDSDITVYDEDAKSEDELQNSYVGKVICECPICHSYIFKDKIDLVFDEDKEKVNVDDECPYCCEAGSGYTIIGEVKAYSGEDEAEEEAKEETEESPAEEESKEEKEEAPAEEEEVEEVEEVKDESIEECVETPKNLDPDKFTADEKNQQQELVEEKEDVNPLEEEIVVILNNTFGEDGWKDAEYDEDTGCLEVALCDECVNKYNIIEGKLYDIKNHAIVEKKCKNCDDVSECNECNECNESIENGINLDANDKETPDELKPDKIVPDESSEGQELVEDIDKIEITKEDGTSFEVASDSESNEVTVTSNDVSVKVSSDGEVKPEAEGAVEVAPEETEAEAEAPAEEVVAEYAGPESQEEVDAAAEAEEQAEEAPAEEVPAEEEEKVEDETEVEVKDIDLESFDRIGNNYLKAVYENVESYSTDSATLDNDNNKIILEGIISFKSGKTVPTKFVFEAKDINDANKTRFVGTNEAISHGRRPFTLTGSINEGKYIVESMTYHYRAKSPSGKSVRVNVTIN